MSSGAHKYRVMLDCYLQYRISTSSMFHFHHEKHVSTLTLYWVFHLSKRCMESPQVSGISLTTFHVWLACDCAIPRINKCDKKAWLLVCNSVTSLQTIDKECLMAQHGQWLCSHGNSTQINWCDPALQLNTAIITLNCLWHLNHSIFRSFISIL